MNPAQRRPSLLMQGPVVGQGEREPMGKPDGKEGLWKERTVGRQKWGTGETKRCGQETDETRKCSLPSRLSVP